jgi:ABC-type Co2+ transport system permease subunit
MTLPFYKLSYWLTTKPPVVGGTIGYVLFGVFLLFVLAGVFVRVRRMKELKDKYEKRLLSQISIMLIVLGLLGLLLYFFSFEGITLLGARFWYPVWLLAVAGWVAWIVYYARVTIPEFRKRAGARKQIDKYLPRKKKK